MNARNPLISIVAILMLPAISLAATAAPIPQLKAMADAYNNLKSLSVAGTIDLSAEIDGQSAHHHAAFKGAYGGGDKFRHEVVDDVIASCDGAKVYVFQPKANLFTQADAPDDGTIPQPVQSLLMAQDPSLALALSGDASGQLLAGATASQAQPDGTIQISYPDHDLSLTLDPATHLIQRLVMDESRGLRQRGADVKTAMITIDYSATTPNAKLSPADLTFTPPPTADEAPPFAQPKAAVLANDLVGKPAPSFHLNQLDGGAVSNADLKGSVYILDFWATWCGPCRQSLPGLNKIYDDRKAAGLKVFAVNEQEDAPTVKQFIGQTGLTIPVLLDSDGSVGQAFGASAIPETVVIGKDGNVRNVFVGSGNEDGIAAAADSALHEAAPSAQ